MVKMYKSKLHKVIVTEGIKAAELARKTKLASSTIYKAVNGVRIPNITNQHLILKKINEILGKENYSLKDIF